MRTNPVAVHFGIFLKIFDSHITTTASVTNVIVTISFFHKKAPPDLSTSILPSHSILTFGGVTDRRLVIFLLIADFLKKIIEFCWFIYKIVEQNTVHGDSSYGWVNLVFGCASWRNSALNQTIYLNLFEFTIYSVGIEDRDYRFKLHKVHAKLVVLLSSHFSLNTEIHFWWFFFPWKNIIKWTCKHVQISYCILS